MQPSELPEGVEFRPIRADDREFLCRLYASTRKEEVARTGWSEAEQETFLRFQFEAQHAFYMEHFAGADFELVLQHGEAIGRLYNDRRNDEIRIIDIALLTSERRNGVGGALLREVLAEAEAAAKPVRIHVERNNPALHLYHRLGFKEIEDQGVYYLMEWRPE